MLLRAVAIAPVLLIGLSGLATAQEPSHMRYYMEEFKYADNAVKAMVEHPQDRSATARKVTEGVGGKFDGIFFFVPGGEYDGFVLAEFPDDVTARALQMVVAASGNFQKQITIPLLTADDFKMAMEKAKQTRSAFMPPTEAK